MASSSDPELKGGFLPAWMKTKPSMSNRDFDTPYGSSPPAHDEAFFYFRYPKAETILNVTGVTSNSSRSSDTTSFVQAADTRPTQNQQRDWAAGHTEPCKDVLHGIAPIPSSANPIIVKPRGTDDGFKGKESACGSSVVKVAHKMISSSRGGGAGVPPRGFAVASPSEDSRDPNAEILSMGNYNLSARRGSKSLPATPLHSPPTSPSSRRKNRPGNRFFTSPFETVAVEGAGAGTDSRSWLMSALLGYKRDMTGSSSTLHEEHEESHTMQGNLSLAASVERLGPAPPNKPSLDLQGSANPADDSQSVPKPQIFRAKPSELRELNFWSPTSM